MAREKNEVARQDYLKEACELGVITDYAFNVAQTWDEREREDSRSRHRAVEPWGVAWCDVFNAFMWDGAQSPGAAARMTNVLPTTARRVVRGLEALGLVAVDRTGVRWRVRFPDEEAAMRAFEEGTSPG